MVALYDGVPWAPRADIVEQRAHVVGGLVATVGDLVNRSWIDRLGTRRFDPVDVVGPQRLEEHVSAGQETVAGRSR